MKITKFSFKDKSQEWNLEEIAFKKLTLLVGASGVGKTQILRALINVKNIAKGASLDGVSWYLQFETLDKKTYIWQGEFEKKGFSIYMEEGEENNENKPKILFEQLYLNNELIVERTSEKIIFNNQPTLKLSQQESVLHLLKEEDLIKSAHEGLRKLYFSDHSNSSEGGNRLRMDLLNSNKLLKKYNTLEKIQESEFGTEVKLFFLSNVDNKIFSNIKERFVSIFPQVEDIKIAPIEKDKEMPDFLKDYPFIQIKEQKVNHWISQERISSGMYRSLMQLSELYLCPEGTIFLIDEFENSLGINCINEITMDILTSQRQLQFILTSHHPYIIDSIHHENWKLITRNAGVIKAHDVGRFDIGKSKHSAFMQLLQLEEYQTGREA